MKRWDPGDGHLVTPRLKKGKPMIPPPLPPTDDRFLLICFIRACGLRRTELEQLRSRDISEDDQGHTHIHVAASAEYPERNVLVLAEFSWVVTDTLLGHRRARGRALLTLQDVQQRQSPGKLLFPLGIPLDLDVEPLRYEYAWSLYVNTIEAFAVVVYPSTFHEVAQQVKRAMGWKRMDPRMQRWIARDKRQFVRDAEDAGMLPAKQE
jgi:hypothetical protein